MKQSTFETLAQINVNEHKEQKNGLNYLSWTWAWTELQKRYPDATYKIRMNENNLPYFESPLGIMVYTELTIEGTTHLMWLPVMDSFNRAMKTQRYSYQVFDRYKNAYVEKWVEAATMMDVNKAVMRCLTKNIAIFGLGLYVYANEDLPEIIEEPEQVPAPAPVKKAATAKKTTAQKEVPTPAPAPAKAPEIKPATEAEINAVKRFFEMNEKAKAGYEKQLGMTADKFDNATWKKVYSNLVYHHAIEEVKNEKKTA